MSPHSSNQQVRRERRQDIALWYETYKAGLSCVRCGFSDHRALEFHHRRPEDKVKAVADLVKDGRSVADVLAEVAKCDAVCANCHRIAHRWAADQGQLLRTIRKRESRRQPKLCHHRSSGRAYVTDPLTSAEVYFGPWGCPIAERSYRAWLVLYQFRFRGGKRSARRKSSWLEMAEVEIFRRAERVLRRVVERGRVNPHLLIALNDLLADLDTVRGPTDGTSPQNNPIPVQA